MIQIDLTINGVTIGAYKTLEQFSEALKRYEALNGQGQKTVLAFVEANGCDFEEALTLIDNGGYEFYSDMNLEEVAEKLVNEGRFGNLEQIKPLANFIDYDLLGRHLGVNGYVKTSQGVICSG